MGVLAEQFARRGVGVGSVAGDRGRAVNYVYGSAKAGFTAFLSGLRNRLAGSGVHVVTVWSDGEIGFNRGLQAYSGTMTNDSRSFGE